MTEARFDHCSCATGGYVYVAGGRDKNVWVCNSIERINMRAAKDGWDLLNLNIDSINIYRMANLSDNEFLIFGSDLNGFMKTSGFTVEVG